MKVIISLSVGAPPALRKETMGPVSIEIKYDKASESYSISWTNKMTNVVTKLVKIGKESFMVENKAPKTPLTTFSYKDVRECCMTFFANADIRRVSETMIAELRKLVAEQVKAFEKKRTLNINIRNLTFSKEHKAMNMPVFIGNNREQKGIMVGINWAGTRAKVALFDENDLPTRIVELDSALVWIP